MKSRNILINLDMLAVVAVFSTSSYASDRVGRVAEENLGMWLEEGRVRRDPVGRVDDFMSVTLQPERPVLGINGISRTWSNSFEAGLHAESRGFWEGVVTEAWVEEYNTNTFNYHLVVGDREFVASGVAPWANVALELKNQGNPEDVICLTFSPDVTDIDLTDSLDRVQVAFREMFGLPVPGEQLDDLRDPVYLTSWAYAPHNGYHQAFAINRCGGG